jgi:hypothetical protein
MLNHHECAEAASQLMRLGLPKMLAPSGMRVCGIVSRVFCLMSRLQEEGRQVEGDDETVWRLRRVWEGAALCNRITWKLGT